MPMPAALTKRLGIAHPVLLGPMDLVADAAECFIDFWMGKGVWARTPEPRKGRIASSVVNDAICRFLERGR
jgi:hypothetical protein